MEIRHLYFSYGKTRILNDVNIKFNEGKITTLLGANGSGKSTLFNICARNLTPDRGIIRLNGENIFDMNRREFARNVAIVHQHNSVVGDTTVNQLVSYGRTPYMKLMKSKNDEDREAVEWAVRVTGLSGLEQKLVRSLSGGQRQRVWIAMALAQKSRMLFLDEPTTYLDIRYQLELLELIRDLNETLGITVVMVLHDINQAIKYSHNLVGLKAGEVLFDGESNTVVTGRTISDLYDIGLDVKEFGGLKVVIPNNRTIKKGGNDD